MPATPSGQPKPAPLAPLFRLAGQRDLATFVELAHQFNVTDASPFDAHVTHAAPKRFLDDPALGRLWLILAGEVPIGSLALTFGARFEYHGWRISSSVTPGSSTAAISGALATP